MRMPCHGEKEIEQCLVGIPMFPGPAPIPCPLLVPTPPAPEPLLSTVLGLTKSPPPPLCRTQRPEDITTSSGETGCPMDPVKCTSVWLLSGGLAHFPFPCSSTCLPGQASVPPLSNRTSHPCPHPLLGMKECKSPPGIHLEGWLSLGGQIF